MNLTTLITGVLLALALLGFGFYALLAVRHAAHFRYLSARTITLTLFFVGLSAVLVAACLFIYSSILLN